MTQQRFRAKKTVRGVLRLWLVTAMVLVYLFSAASRGAAQEESDYLERAQEIMRGMTIPERVGQLFLITFEGDATGANSDIVDLILRYKVGGVILLAQNDNIVGDGNDVPLAVADLNNRLQRLALLGDSSFITSTVTSDAATATPVSPSPGTAPLFVAIQQDGDGPPFSQIRYGLTELPSPMAIGASWQPHYAEDVGHILGRELSTIGVNMLLGPPLDVLEHPDADNASDLGVRAFGGDPYWVGLMGRAYTTGVHRGSDGRIAVVAKHFPGRGSSDRPLEEEVSTVRKSLDQLREVELAPFFQVTGPALDPLATTDALLVTHIRYQGFQGNLRDTTAPVSFDPPALQTLMSLPELEAWRNNGGVTVSDSLGVRAVQKFFDNSGQEFPHRQVAKDALLAGNDVLYIDQFALNDSDMDAQMANLRDSITWFQEKYLTDPAFQQRVDDALLRILQLKLKMYDGDFSLENVLVEASQVQAELRQSQATTLGLAQEALTLISPNPDELQERIPGPPGPEDQIVIFTDVRQWQQCSDCPPEAYIAQDSLQSRMLALYGPDGSAQINPQQLISFTFEDLDEFLAAGPGAIPPPTPLPGTPAAEDDDDEGDGTQIDPTPTIDYSPEFQVQSALQNAEWVIFATLNPLQEQPQSTVIKRFLAQRPDVVRNTRTIVFAYNAPYYLDTTEVSKLTAYYAVYSKIDAFLDISVRTLFQERPARGHSPVDIRATDYELREITQPGANQVIDLFVVRDGSPESPPSEAPMELVVGDTLRLRTGIITDKNGHAVPDGTPVQFVQQDRLQGFVSVIGERRTVSGVAELDYVLEARTGQFRITATAGDARSSQQLDIAIGENVRVVVVTLTPAPTVTVTNTPQPTETPQPTSTVAPTASPTALPVELPPEPITGQISETARMLLAVIGSALLINVSGLLLVRTNGRWDRTRFVRLAAWGMILGFSAYNYFALRLPGTHWIAPLGAWAAFLTTTVGGLAGLFIGWQQDAGRGSLSQRRGATGD